MGWDIELGEVVDREDLHRTYGGNLSAVIAPSAQTPNVFLFLEPEQLGLSAGVRWYGDYLVVPGGSANHGVTGSVLRHGQENRSIRLFRGRSGEVTFLGTFALDRTHPTRIAPEQPGVSTSAQTQFVLRPLATVAARDPLWRRNMDPGGGVVFVAHGATVHADAACSLLWTAEEDGPVITRSVTRRTVESGPVDGPLCPACLPERVQQRLGLAQATMDSRFEWAVRFRLDPPTGGTGWRLQLLTFAAAHPDLLLSPDDLRSGRADLVHGDGTAVQCLIAIDEATGVRGLPHPEVLRHDCIVDLTEDELREFLEFGIPELEANGYLVLRPEIQRPNLRFVARLDSPVDSLLNLRELLEFRWDVAIGDESLTEEELAALMDQKRPLVALHGQWLELWPPEITAELETLAQHIGTRATLSVEELMQGEGLRGPGGVRAEVDLPPAAWVRVVGAYGRSRPVVLPGFTERFRPYQREGASWLLTREALGVGALLADEMGLGKTAQILAVIAADHLDRDEPPNTPTLVVAPLTVLRAWRDEITKWCPELRHHVHQGSGRLHREAFFEAIGGADVVLTNYDTLRNDRTMLEQVPWRRLVLDEAQNVKNPSTLTRRVARALPAEHRIALTGTPVENRYRDLWSIVDVVNPGMLGTQAEFDARFGRRLDDGDEVAADELLELVAPLMLRRLKADPAHQLGLPEKLETKTYCQLTPEQVALYQLAIDQQLEIVNDADDQQRRLLVGNLLVRLKQICDHPWLVDKSTARSARSGKLDRLDELLDEALASGEKVLVFTEFVDMGHLLVDHVRDQHGVGVDFLYGKTEVDDRARMVAGINSDDEQRVLVLQIKAGGSGLTLTGANTVVHYDRWWNPAVEDQATDRVHRIGQTRTVLAAKFICIGTFEERLDALLEQKRARGSLLLEPIAELSRLPGAQLEDVLRYDGP